MEAPCKEDKMGEKKEKTREERKLKMESSKKNMAVSKEERMNESGLEALGDQRS